MDVEGIAVVAAAFFFAAFVKGVTGLGFSTSALPLLALTLGIKAALPLVIIPSVSSNVVVMIKAGHFREMLRRFAWMYLAAVVGIAVGLAVLNAVDGRTAGAALGAILAAYAALAWRDQGPALPAAWGQLIQPAVGFVTGAINGLTGSQVIPVLPYLLALRLDRDRFVQAINISFTISSLTMAIGLTQIGLMTTGAVALSVGGLVPVYVGLKLGGAVQDRLSAEGFRRAVLLVLGATGLVLVAKALV